MRNEELTAVLQELARAGVHDPVIAKGGRHLQVRWQTSQGVRFCVVAASGSDWRGPRNARAEVRRLLRADGLLSDERAEILEPAPPAAKSPTWKTELARLERRVARLEAKLAGA
jgi:hypothetical protein